MLPLLPPPAPHTVQTAGPAIPAISSRFNPPSAPAVTSSIRLPPPNPPPPPIPRLPPTPSLKEQIAVRAGHPPPPPPPHSQQIDHRRAYNCEIMLSKVKVSLHDLVDEIDIWWKLRINFRRTSEQRFSSLRWMLLLPQ
ncbi:hypothetical protein I3842_15G155300 [Carya illinoinensis]|uniref:Uncharacterized protein n=1 Tax=Carya illinoinensis TaxID=32201 RepID=A0A922D952_CARIL|nr:hypothetical protein I3842_15G155300 [Carya illinoinensis]